MQTVIPFDIEDIDVARRTDYTFKYNTRLGRHGWLRLTPAYSVKLVHEIIRKDCKKGDMILDPFSGTATTGLVASELGFSSVSYEINPFLIWLGNIKCNNYSVRELDALRKQFAECLEVVTVSDGHWIPPIHNIKRWWHNDTLAALASIRNQLVETFGEPNGNHYHNLVWVAFSRLIIETSSAAFNHISMSFREDTVQYGLTQIKLLFQTIFTNIIISAKTQLSGNAQVVYTDSKTLPTNETNRFDALITSPPYPNRISYIRELRPYMYWVKFLKNGSDAGALDWEAIGGTWGVATSNLKNWTPLNNNLPGRLYEICEKIGKCEDKNAEVMSRYVHKYFDNIHSHLLNMSILLKPDAKVNYIVGNSSFYGYFVETQEIIAEIMKQIGYMNVCIHTIRRRNTKKGLLEYNVKANWKLQ
ncbi:MAG: site-specific DNA-methyltransferase [Dysgonamonadaceae bacterium]|jgi:DNA modification methylase|nr:site-specific DNA-methyltransferase [Dysgonamonadaceae bacterium]